MAKKDPKAHYEKMLHFEKKAAGAGFFLPAGVDEAGRGPLAGPVAAAACILDPAQPVYGLDDSKKLSAGRREELYRAISTTALSCQVVFVDAAKIDRINIRKATLLDMTRAVQGLGGRPDLLLVDAESLPDLDLPCWSIKKGDTLSVSIAAASILAKVTRDRLMQEYDRLYPAYGLARHKGYGTREHYAALLEHGPTPLHRLTFLKNLRQHRQDRDS